MVALGVIYDTGLPPEVPKSIFRAATWYARAAAKGDHRSISRLAALRGNVGNWEFEFI